MRLVYFCLLGLCLAVSETIAQDTLIQRIGLDFMKAPEAVGLSIGIYHLNQAHCYHFGTTEKGSQQPPTAATIYEIGSLTKTFISTLLAAAVLEGRVKLDDDIRAYLPEPYPNLAYQGQPIKMVHLANLTSELPNWLPDKPELFRGVVPDSIPFVLLNLHKNYTRQDFYRDLHTIQLKAPPGTLTRHANVAAQLLAFILEKVYQKPSESLVKQYITQPLGMRNTLFINQQTGLMAQGYDAKGNRMPFITAMQNLREAGGLTSTTSDMVKYLKFQLNEADRRVELTHQRTVKTAEGAVGLNWHVDETVTGDREIWHTGGTFGFSSYAVIYPARKLGIIVLANESDGSTQRRLVDVARQVAAGLQSVKN